ncbi:LPD29 domain-containing protein [Streptacidiphilus sp. EB103A]|uniref:LPD29 domain-containing protein n=1 Tax=Streptacidiphilus sp. EB103A TaxID=3156275 RepID=UPI0035166C75
MSDTMITRADVTAPAYLAMRLNPGTEVEYRGSQAQAHGAWKVRPCSCTGCTARVLLGFPANRYALIAADGTAGPHHVRHTSVVPVLGEEERMEAGIWLSTRDTALHLRRLLRTAFPATKFSVRCGRRDAKGLARYEITVTWTGGPTRTAVATLTAPLLATHGNSTHRRPAAVHVATGGHRHIGTPSAHAIHLDRR